MVKSLQKAGVDFAIRGAEEPCNGETARRIGNEYLFQSMAEMTVEVLGGYKVKKILTNCPHCFNTFKNDYPQFNGHYEVLHATEFVEQLIREGKIEFNLEEERRITYPDSCYLGRYNDVTDAPRSILGMIPGVGLEEMERSGRFGMCCGAGGGRMWMEEEPEKLVNLSRAREVVDSGVTTVAVACPFCKTMLSDGMKHLGKDEEIRVAVLAQILATGLPDGASQHSVYTPCPEVAA